MENHIKEILELVQSLHIKSDSLEKDNYRLQNQNNKILSRIDDLERDISNTPIQGNQILQNQYLTIKDILSEYPHMKKSTLYKIFQNHQSNGLNVIQKDEGGTYTVQRKEWDFWFNNQLFMPNFQNTQIDNNISDILNKKIDTSNNHLLNQKIKDIEIELQKKIPKDNNFNDNEELNLSF